MNIREAFKKLVIEKIHGLPYEDALKIEWENSDREYSSGWENDKRWYKGFPITIGRVMQAFANKEKWNRDERGQCFFDVEGAIIDEDLLLYWKLTKKNGREWVDDDHSKETIEALYNLIKENKNV